MDPSALALPQRVRADDRLIFVTETPRRSAVMGHPRSKDDLRLALQPGFGGIPDITDCP